MIGMLDLYGLLVENVFGGVGIAIVGVAVLLMIIGALSKKSMALMIAEVCSFLAVSALYYSWWSMFLVIIAVLVYFFASLIKFWSGGNN
jgi:Mg2+/Co2+ transporter CorB